MINILIYAYSIWAIVIKMAIIRLLGSSLPIQTVFLDMLNKHKTKIRQSYLIFLFICVYSFIKVFKTTINTYNFLSFS